jgi:hypothetical protein
MMLDALDMSAVIPMSGITSEGGQREMTESDDGVAGELGGTLDKVFDMLTEGVSESHKRRLRGVMISLVTLLLASWDLTADEEADEA